MLLLSTPYHFGQVVHMKQSLAILFKVGANFKVTSIVSIAVIAAGFVVAVASYDLNLVQRPRKYIV